MSANHVMIDFETMSLNRMPALLSLSGIKFDADADSIPADCPRFHKLINLRSTVDLGGDIDPDTVMWWLQQEPEAIKAILEQEEDHKWSVTSVFEAFIAWFNTEREVATATRMVNGEQVPLFPAEEKGKFIYSHGADFDIVIAKDYIKELELNQPWHYRDQNDTRTLFRKATQKVMSDPNFALRFEPKYGLFDSLTFPWETLPGEVLPDYGIPKVKHFGLYDCLNQALAVQRANKILGV